MDPARVARAAAALEDGTAHVEATGEGEYRVASFTAPERDYTVRLEDRECSCPDSRFRGTKVCKHVALVGLVRGLGG